MKGTSYNGSHFANKGTSRSEGVSMFSVNNLVAFQYGHFCSPDGRSRSRGLIPTPNDYLLQEEITLEEYDNTTSDRYGSGNYDCKNIVEIEDLFWHSYSSSGRGDACFLLQVLDSPEELFPGLIKGSISEVRNHSGKYLHIYSIPERFWECEKQTFLETVQAINEKWFLETAYTNKVVANNFRDVELYLEISASGWYKPSVSLDLLKTDNSIIVTKEVTDGYYNFYAIGYPFSIQVSEGMPWLSIKASSSWCNSQKWWFDQIEEINIQPGWIMVNGQDVYQGTVNAIKAHLQEKKDARAKKFATLSQRVAERYGEQTLKAVLKNKGSVLSILKALVDGPLVSPENLETILNVSGDAMVISNLLILVDAKIDPIRVGKIAGKAQAWAYVRKSLPGVNFLGHFDEAVSAITLYAENWHRANTAGNTIGDFAEMSGIKL